MHSVKLLLNNHESLHTSLNLFGMQFPHLNFDLLINICLTHEARLTCELFSCMKTHLWTFPCFDLSQFDFLSLGTTKFITDIEIDTKRRVLSETNTRMWKRLNPS